MRSEFRSPTLEEKVYGGVWLFTLIVLALFGAMFTKEVFLFDEPVRSVSNYAHYVKYAPHSAPKSPKSVGSSYGGRGPLAGSIEDVSTELFKKRSYRYSGGAYSAVPEPATIMIFGLGSAFLLSKKTRKR